MVFEIPDSLIHKKMILNYVDNNNDIIKINVGPSNLNKKDVKESASLTQALDFKDSPLKEVSMKINSYEIAPTFTLHYNYCVSSSNCYDSIEYLKPGTSHNVSTVLMKLQGEITGIDHVLKVYNLFDFLNYFGSIRYEIGGEEKTMNIGFVQVVPNKTTTNDLYIEVTNEVASADKVDIVLNIHNKIYTYHLK